MPTWTWQDWQINGQHLTTPPTEAGWVNRRPLDVSGENRAIYPGIHEFEMKWVLLSYQDWAALQVLFNARETTGTSVVKIPAYPSITGSAFAFREYSGVMIDEPSVGMFFEEFPRQVVLMIRNIAVR
jgi:hypothetical protein